MATEASWRLEELTKIARDAGINFDQLENDFMQATPLQHTLPPLFDELEELEKKREKAMARSRKTAETMTTKIEQARKLVFVLLDKLGRSFDSEKSEVIKFQEVIHKKDQEIGTLKQLLLDLESQHNSKTAELERALLNTEKLKENSERTRRQSDSTLEVYRELKTKQDRELESLKQNEKLHQQKVTDMEEKIHQLQIESQSLREQNMQLQEKVSRYDQRISFEQSERQKVQEDRERAQQELQEKSTEHEVAVIASLQAKERADTYKAKYYSAREELARKDEQLKNLEEINAQLKPRAEQSKETSDLKSQLDKVTAEKEDLKRNVLTQCNSLKMELGMKIRDLKEKENAYQCCQLQISALEAQLKETREQLQVDENKVTQLRETIYRQHRASLVAKRVQKGLDKRLKNFLLEKVASRPVSPFAEREIERFKRECSIRPRQELQFNKKIGQGAFACAYAVNLNGTPCIAKRLHDILMGRGSEEPVAEKTKEEYYSRFLRECILTRQVSQKSDHPNIIKFIGVYFEKTDRYDLTLFIEELSMSLEKYLNSASSIPLPVKVSILLDVSCGLSYLHNECSIIHRDLTAANILLTRDNKAKIADLGVSKILEKEEVQKMYRSKVPGAIGYMPPEVLRAQDPIPCNKSLDIFSFGIVSLYIAIQEFPEFSWDRVPDVISDRGECEIYKRRKWIDAMKKKQPELTQLVLLCLSDHPSERPSIVWVSVILEEIKNELN